MMITIPPPTKPTNAAKIQRTTRMKPRRRFLRGCSHSLDHGFWALVTCSFC